LSWPSPPPPSPGSRLLTRQSSRRPPPQSQGWSCVHVRKWGQAGFRAFSCWT
jgi:hypothetical protein